MTDAEDSSFETAAGYTPLLSGREHLPLWPNISM
jgi:hypothetical protein